MNGKTTLGLFSFKVVVGFFPDKVASRNLLLQEDACAKNLNYGKTK